MIYQVVTDLGIVVFDSVSRQACELFCKHNDFDFSAIKEVKL